MRLVERHREKEMMLNAIRLAKELVRRSKEEK